MQIDVRHEPCRAFIQLEGDLDVTSASAVYAALDEAHQQGATEIRVDVSRVGFVDSAGLSPLLRWLSEARQRGDVFSVEGARGLVKRVLRETGTHRMLEA